MPEREDVLTVVREWVLKAENDLKTAAHTLLLGRECPTDTDRAAHSQRPFPTGPFIIRILLPAAFHV